MKFYRFYVDYHSYTHNKTHSKCFITEVEYDPNEEGLNYFQSLRAEDDIQILSFTYEECSPRNMSQENGFVFN